MTAFIDTNVFVYMYDQSDIARGDVSESLLRSEPDFVISAQILGELFVTLTRKLSTTAAPDFAERIVRRLADRRVVPVDARLVDRALALQASYPISYWDALIVEAAAAAGCDTLYTEDLADGDTIRGIRIVDPFRSLPA